MNTNQKEEAKVKKNFLRRWFEKLDKKLEEKSKKTSCCSGEKNKGSSCC